jgi:hypothetical protein
MPKTAFGVETFLHDFHPVSEERQSDLALRSITGNESREVPLDVGFTNRFADVWVAAAGHPLAVELHFDFVATESEDAKVIAPETVEAVNLSSRDCAGRAR